MADHQDTYKKNRIVCDDVVTIDCVTNPEMISKTAIGGAIWYIGTRVHYADTCGEIIKRYKRLDN